MSCGRPCRGTTDFAKKRRGGLLGECLGRLRGLRLAASLAIFSCEMPHREVAQVSGSPCPVLRRCDSALEAGGSAGLPAAGVGLVCWRGSLWLEETVDGRRGCFCRMDCDRLARAEKSFAGATGPSIETTRESLGVWLGCLGMRAKGGMSSREGCWWKKEEMTEGSSGCRCRRLRLSTAGAWGSCSPFSRARFGSLRLACCVACSAAWSPRTLAEVGLLRSCGRMDGNRFEATEDRLSLAKAVKSLSL